MADELDLSGDPPLRRRRRGSEETKSRSKSEQTKDDTILQAKLRDNLETAFDRITKARVKAEDEELAQALLEDRDAMTDGLVGLTDHVPVVRQPLLLILGVLVPLLAFRRVGGILVGRLLSWRQRRMETAANAQAVWEAEEAARQAEQGIVT